MLDNRDVVTFERQVTSAERFFAYSPFSIVTVIARIKGDVTEDMLRHAVAQVRRRHALLGARIKEDDEHVQWFTSQGVHDISIEIIPRRSDNDWIAIHAEASKIPFDFETRPAIRFILVRSAAESELIILCHHIICDGMSLAFLARDLMAHLGDPEREAQVLPAPPPVDLNNLPSDVSQSRIVRFFINRMNRKWVQESVFFDREDYAALTKAYWGCYTHKVFSIELTEADTSVLVTRCRKEKVTVNTALATAFGGAQSAVEGKQPYHPKYVVAGNIRDRIPRPVGEAMGFYAGGIELQFNYDHKQSFWENARRFHKEFRAKLNNKNLFRDIKNWLYLDPTMFEAFHFKKLGGLVPSDSDRYEKLSDFSTKKDVVSRILQRDNLLSLETKYWGTAVTNLGRLDFPTTYGALELDRLILQPGGGIPLANVNLVLGAVTCSGKLGLTIEYAAEAVDTDTMDRIKDKAMAYLLDLNPESTFK